MTFPAAKGGQAFPPYSPASILPWDSLGLRPAIQSVRYAFAQAVRLSTVLWESISEGKAKAEGHAKRTPVRLLGRACLIPQRGQKPSEAPGVCHGNAMVYHSELWDFIGVAMEGLSELLG